MKKEDLLKLMDGNFCILIDQDRRKFDKLNELTGNLFTRNHEGARWNGSGDYYGLKHSEFWCSTLPWGKRYSLEEFEQLLNPSVETLDIF